MTTRKPLVALGLMIALATLLALSVRPDLSEAGQMGPAYKILAPLSRGNLTFSRLSPIEPMTPTNF